MSNANDFDEDTIEKMDDYFNETKKNLYRDIESEYIKELSEALKSYDAQVEEDSEHDKVYDEYSINEILKASLQGNELADVGIIDRFGELATILDENVKVLAICRSIHKIVNSVVVRTTDGVECCKDFLKRNNLGKVNFIALDNVKKFVDKKRRIETPFSAQRIIDLLNPYHSEVEPAFYHYFGNILVAPDYETGNRWAFQVDIRKWKIVTSDGCHSWW